MCGICGRTEDPEASAVRLMSDALAHRGPDDRGVHVDPETGLALGATRLSIIDVAGGHQPISNEDGSITAVLNGEIYNHPALQRRLRAAGHTLRTRCDTEVLVHLYEELGPELPHALEGMYAFAIWDARQRRLVLGRDRFGEKPLFYADLEPGLAFASELGALLAGLDEREAAIDESAVDAFFVFGYVPGPSTMVARARQLPPGSVLTWSPGQAPAISSYWQPPAAPSLAHEPRHALIEETGALLRDAVGLRLVADVPLGVFLSGGVDSTLIAALAAERSTQPLLSFSVGYDAGNVSETAKARAVAHRIGSEHHELTLDAASVRALAPAVLESLDQPIADQALIAIHALSRFAREHVKVVVGGEGADELFGGYPRYLWMVRAALLARGAPRALLEPAARGLARLGGRAGRLADVARPQTLSERNLDWVTSGRRWLRPDLYGPRLLDRADLAAVERGVRGALGDAGPDPVGRLMRFDQRHWLPDDVLAKADRAGMLASLEIRTPYLDRSLAEFAASVPSRTHLASGGKALLRGTLAEILPGADRAAKTAFRVPAADWLRGPLATPLEAVVTEGRLVTDGWFRREALVELARRHQDGADHTDVLWPVFVLGSWLEGTVGARVR